MPSQTIVINYTPDSQSLPPNPPDGDDLPDRPHPRPRRGGRQGLPTDKEAYFKSRVYTAQFKITSLDVKLRIREQRDVEPKRMKILSTRYSFISPALSVAGTGALPTSLTWESDSENNAVGNFKLVVDARLEAQRKVYIEEVLGVDMDGVTERLVQAAGEDGAWLGMDKRGLVARDSGDGYCHH
ncbi:uncharacterized protein DSM5745_01772 [Aspergillus mulundensis]|uniref:Uncharacterized protein n=1 Tax=Aspergillus mulundensis TaxID=1810919 RepID=A0A3D8SUK5_9EURO|nr:hypothetical protein DSM5745_01772 [Aspergillus mulundensis]RDW89997.1 hypothetical protein DSM5745_01772 [Aspergillus mulundensis]